MLRVQKDDIDLEAGTALVREKKRRRDVRESTRRVPLSDALKERLRKWLTDHPGGPFLFCHSGVVLRSRKRSRPHRLQGRQDEGQHRQGEAGRSDRPPGPASRPA